MLVYWAEGGQVLKHPPISFALGAIKHILFTDHASEVRLDFTEMFFHRHLLSFVRTEWEIPGIVNSPAYKVPRIGHCILEGPVRNVMLFCFRGIFEQLQGFVCTSQVEGKQSVVHHVVNVVVIHLRIFPRGVQKCNPEGIDCVPNCVPKISVRVWYHASGRVRVAVSPGSSIRFVGQATKRELKYIHGISLTFPSSWITSRIDVPTQLGQKMLEAVC